MDLQNTPRPACPDGRLDFGSARVLAQPAAAPGYGYVDGFWLTVEALGELAGCASPGGIELVATLQRAFDRTDWNERHHGLRYTRILG